MSIASVSNSFPILSVLADFRSARIAGVWSILSQFFLLRKYTAAIYLLWQKAPLSRWTEWMPYPNVYKSFGPSSSARSHQLRSISLLYHSLFQTRTEPILTASLALILACTQNTLPVPRKVPIWQDKITLLDVLFQHKFECPKYIAWFHKSKLTASIQNYPPMDHKWASTPREWGFWFFEYGL